MSWKCPNCERENEHFECVCGWEGGFSNHSPEPEKEPKHGCPECNYAPMDYQGVDEDESEGFPAISEHWVCPACDYRQVNVVYVDRSYNRFEHYLEDETDETEDSKYFEF